MNVDGILPFARILLEKVVPEGSVAVDATAGNGHDTLFLAKLVGAKGTVYAFDVQQAALEATRKRLLAENEEKQVQLIHKGHEHVSESIALHHHGEIAAAIFNLGYLPGGNKAIVTTPENTISAIEQLLSLLKPGGIIVLVIYHGHPEGQAERDALLSYVQHLPQEQVHVLQYQFINQKNNPPFILAIEKR